MSLYRLILRKGLFSQLTAMKPGGLNGEPVWLTDSQELRVADGVTPPNTLPSIPVSFRGSVVINASVVNITNSLVVTYPAFNLTGNGLPFPTYGVAKLTPSDANVGVTTIYMNPTLPQITFYFSGNFPSNDYILFWTVTPPAGS